jgi:hypothetical protein
VYELCIDESSSQNKKHTTNQVKLFRARLQHIFDSYHVVTMFWIFLASTLVSKIMFFSSFIVGIKKRSFKAYYNASIVRDTFVILAARTCLFQGTLNYFCILLGRTLLILNV